MILRIRLLRNVGCQGCFAPARWPASTGISANRRLCSISPIHNFLCQPLKRLHHVWKQLKWPRAEIQQLRSSNIQTYSSSPWCAASAQRGEQLPLWLPPFHSSCLRGAHVKPLLAQQWTAHAVVSVAIEMEQKCWVLLVRVLLFILTYKLNSLSW